MRKPYVRTYPGHVETMVLGELRRRSGEFGSWEVARALNQDRDYVCRVMRRLRRKGRVSSRGLRVHCVFFLTPEQRAAL